jgi:hypothetical protein
MDNAGQVPAMLVSLVDHCHSNLQINRQRIRTFAKSIYHLIFMSPNCFSKTRVYMLFVTMLQGFLDPLFKAFELFLSKLRLQQASKSMCLPNGAERCLPKGLVDREVNK